MNEIQKCRTTAVAAAEGIDTEAFPADLEVLESIEYRSFDPLIVALRLSASRDGIQFEAGVPERTLSPVAARRMARHLLRAAAFAELRGCPVDFPCWPKVEKKK